MKKSSIFWLVWGIIFPILIYHGMKIFLGELFYVMPITRNLDYVVRSGIVYEILILYMYFYFSKDIKAEIEVQEIINKAIKAKSEEEEKTAEQKKKKRSIAGYFISALVTTAVGIGLNYVILNSPLPEMSKNYQEASASLYSGSLIAQVVVSGLLAPMAEEILYRGILFRRIRFLSNFYAASFISALIFGLMHMNIVQFIYAFLMGLILSFWMEMYKHVSYPFVGHALCNIVAVLMSAYL